MTELLQPQAAEQANIPKSIPYETERGTAYRPINQFTGEQLVPQPGIEIDIYDEWAAEAVSDDMSRVDTFIAGEDDEYDYYLPKTVNTIGNLSLLFVDSDRVERIVERTLTDGPDWYKDDEEKIREVLATRQLEILASIMPDNGTLSHYSQGNFTEALLKAKALRPKTGHDEYRTFSGIDADRVRKEGQAFVVQHIDQAIQTRELTRQSRGDVTQPYADYPMGPGLHSLLVHFAESSPRAGIHTSMFFYPRSAIFDRTPYLVAGQDAGGGVKGTRSTGDEAHRKGPADSRDRYARIHVEMFERIRNALPERRNSQDITFMADVSDPERAVAFEYPFEDGAMFISPHNLESFINNLSEDQLEAAIPRSVRERCSDAYLMKVPEEERAKFSFERFAFVAKGLLKQQREGKDVQFSSEENKVFWDDVLPQIDAMEKEIEASGLWLDDESRDMVARTVMTRRALKTYGYDPEWVDSSVFISADGKEVSYHKIAEAKMRRLLEAKTQGFAYIQARADKLQFDQVDLMKLLPVYKKHRQKS